MKRSLSLTALGAATLLALAACGSDDALETNDDGLTELTVYQITTTDSTPLYLGVQEGFFEDEGLDVDIKIAESGSAIIPSVMNGESQIGYANVVSDLAAVDQGLDIKFVSDCCGVGADPKSSTSEVFVLEDSDIKGPEDLPGKKIAVNSTKNLGDVTIPAALENEGIDPDGIEYVPMNYSDMSGALERGDVDAIWMVEPFRTVAYDNDYRPVLANFVEAFPDSTLGYYITSGDFAESNPEVVQSFQKAMDKSNEYAMENTDKLRELAVSEVGLDQDVADRINFGEYTSGLDTDSIKLYGEASVDQGIISKEPDYDSLLVTPEK